MVQDYNRGIMALALMLGVVVSIAVISSLIS
jgi:hypothetical protein